VGAVLLLAEMHARYIGFYDLWVSPRLAWVTFYALATAVGAYANGLPDDVGDQLRTRVSASLRATLFGAVSVSLVQLVVGAPLLPRFVVFWASLFGAVWYLLCARYQLDITGRPSGERVCVIATPEELKVITDELSRAPERRATIVFGAPAETLLAGGDSALVTVAEETQADLVVLDRAAQSNSSLVSQAALLHQTGVRFRTLSLFYEDWLGKLPVSELEQVSLMFDIGELHRSTYARSKRIADVFAGLVLSIVLALLIIPVLALNALWNRGPLLYKQQRVGRGGRVFTIYKLRTMTASGASHWTHAEDQRVTRAGRWFRRAHVDEVPQALNLLKGDLSLVGPRPEQPSYVRNLSEQIPFYDARHIVRPGITGWAQVKSVYAASVEETREKLQYDFYYLRRQSFTLDARIIARTLRSVLAGRGR